MRTCGCSQALFADLSFDSRLPASSDTSKDHPDPYTYALQYGSADDHAFAVWKVNGTLGCPPASAARGRQDCGFWGISQSECLSRGCCFELPYVGPGAQCYYHVVVNATGTVTFPAPASTCYTTQSVVGAPLGRVCTQGTTLSVVASTSPVYLVPSTSARGRRPLPPQVAWDGSAEATDRG